jgi:hypothetical protein
MLRSIRVALVRSGAAVLSLAASAGNALATPSTPALAKAQVSIPLFFEQLPSKPGAPAAYIARGQNYSFRVSAVRIDFSLRTSQLSADTSSVHRDEYHLQSGIPSRFVSMNFVGANPQAPLSGIGEMEGKINYLTGNDPAAWRSQVSVFSSVRVTEIYPGVDIAYYGNQHQLEYDFLVASEADPSAIRLKFGGASKVSVNSQRELVLAIEGAELHQHRPVIYQIVKGSRREVSGGYSMIDAGTVGFALGDYDRRSPLIIDPMFSYSTYFGGNAGDTGLSIKVDSSGSVYVAGETLSTTFPAASSTTPFQGQQHGGTSTGDAFVAKLDSTGSKLIYFTYLGGSGDDGAYDLAIDAGGNAYLTGFTVSSDFPTKNAIFSHISGSPDSKFQVYPVDGFVAKLNPSGSGLVFSTYLGGSASDLGSAIAVDPAGYIYVTGYSFSSDFPVVNAFQSQWSGNSDAFVTKFAPNGQSLVYSTYLGGSAIDQGQGIAADAAGYAYVSGYTASINFPVTAGASRTNLNGSGSAVTVYDAFVTKISPNGRSLAYSTYFGGSQNDFGYRIAVDGAGNAYLVGTTQSADMPHSNAFGLKLGNDGTNSINFDAFLTKFGVTGKPIYTAQFGGNLNDAAWDVAVDSAGRAFVVGITSSTDFPVVRPFDLFRTANSGGKDVFVVAFDTNPGPVLYSGYFGGASDDFGYAIAVDDEANAYISGMTLSSVLPTKIGALDRSLSGTSDSFVAKIRLTDPMLNVTQSGNTFQLSWPATAPDYGLQSTSDLTPPQVWTTVSQTPALSTGVYSVSITSSNATTLFRLVHR